MTALETWVAGDQVLASELNGNFSQVEGSQQVLMTLGEAVTDNDVVAIGDGTDGFAIKNTTNTGTTFIFGHNADGTAQGARVAQSFPIAITGPLLNVSLRMRKVGTPSGNVVCAIQADSAGSPSGTDLDTATVAFASITGSYSSIDFVFTHVNLSAGTYWAVFRVSGSLSGTDYGEIDGSNANDYASGAVKIFKNTGSVWTADSANHDLHGAINAQIAAGELCKASAVTNTNRANAILGLAQATGVRGNQIYVTTFGNHPGDSGLSPGVHYFLQNTQGAKGTSAGSISIRVGVARTATIFHVRIER